MANPLFNSMASMPQGNNMMDLLNRFNQFRQTFQGDPRQAVQNLLNSGRMTQAQYNQYQQMAMQIQNLLSR